MEYYFNPHLGFGLKQEIEHRLRVSYRIYQEIISHTQTKEVRFSTHPQVNSIFNGILAAINTDILSLIYQFEQIKASVHRTKVYYTLHFSMPYSLVLPSGNFIIDQNYSDLWLEYKSINEKADTQFYQLFPSYLNLSTDITQIIITDKRTSDDIIDILGSDNPHIAVLVQSKPQNFVDLREFISSLSQNSSSPSRSFVEEIISLIEIIESQKEDVQNQLSIILEKISDRLAKLYDFVNQDRLIKKTSQIIIYRIKKHLLNFTLLEVLMSQNWITSVLTWNSWIGSAQILPFLQLRHDFKIYGYQHGMFLREPIYFSTIADVQFLFHVVEQEKLQFYRKTMGLSVIGYPISGVDSQLQGDIESIDTVLIILQLLQTSPELLHLLNILSRIIPKFQTLNFVIRKHPRDQDETNDLLSDLIEFENVSYDHNKKLIDSLQSNIILIGMNSSALLDGLFLGKSVIEWLPYQSSFTYLSDYYKVPTFTTQQELEKVLSDLQQHGAPKIQFSDKFISYRDYFDRILRKINNDFNRLK